MLIRSNVQPLTAEVMARLETSADTFVRGLKKTHTQF